MNTAAEAAVARDRLDSDAHHAHVCGLLGAVDEACLMQRSSMRVLLAWVLVASEIQLRLVLEGHLELARHQVAAFRLLRVDRYWLVEQLRLLQLEEIELQTLHK